jgi:hypothetical protein
MDQKCYSALLSNSWEAAKRPDGFIKPLSEWEESTKKIQIKMEIKMLKKIVLGTMFVILIGGLVTGAVIRTMDKTEQNEQQAGSGRGFGKSSTLETAQVSEGQGNGNGQGRSGSNGNGTSSAGRGRGGNGDGDGSDLLAEENSDHVWEPAYSGEVSAVSDDALTIETDSGESIIIEGRAWSYMQDQAFSIEQGDQVNFEGFYEDGEFKVSMIENLTTDMSIVLRDADGRPSWAGGGRGNL